MNLDAETLKDILESLPDALEYPSPVYFKAYISPPHPIFRGKGTCYELRFEKNDSGGWDLVL